MRPLVVAAVLASASVPSPAQESPEAFFGFEMGADGRLAPHARIVEYLRHLDESSEWMRLFTLGETTLGKPMVMAVFTTPENFPWLDRWRGIARRLADPRGLRPEEVEDLVREGKAIVLVTCNIHSTEVASAQMAAELAWRIVAGKTPWDRASVLGEAIFLLVPSTNPDGQEMVCEWYERGKGTEHEGGPMPWLYHPYAGHDNNRDWFMFNLVETRLVSDVYYRSWCPQVVLDEHQMGSTGARMFVPPFAEPANPNVHPLIWRSLALIGANLALRLEQKGREGVVDSAYYTAWWEGASIMTPWWHNIVGALTEMASANVASPIYVEPNELSAGRGFQAHEVSVRFPNPWKGGWWRLRDIVDYELDATFALVETVARHREDFLRNMARMASDAVERGKRGRPYAFLLPPAQHDPPTAAWMTEVLQLGGVEVHEARAPFEADGRPYAAGTRVVLLAQPYGLYAKDLLEVQRYPNLREYPGGPPIRPYDMAGWTLGLQMGVETVQVEGRFEADLSLLLDPGYRQGQLVGDGPVWLVSPNTNASFGFANRALAAGAEVSRAAEPFEAGGKSWAPGTWIVRAATVGDPGKMRGGIEAAAVEFHVEAATADAPANAVAVRRPRVALYKPWVASMDEGWTRLLLERFAFEFKNLDNAAVREGKLRDSFDALVLPDVGVDVLLEGKPKGEDARFARPLPPEYAGGIGEEGVKAIREFVEAGGTLVALDSACEFAIAKLDLPLRDALRDVAASEFFCPGSLLRIEVDPTHPLGYGMPREAAAYFVNSPALRTSVPFGKFGRRVVASYPARDPLLSGWILGEERLSRLGAVVEVALGRGRIALLGFRLQHRVQTAGTFKFLFNALFAAAAEAAAR